MKNLDHSIANHLQVVVFVSGLDFGRCPLASRMNRALWPISDKPALEYVIERLAEQGVQRVAVCCEGQVDTIASKLRLPESVQVQFIYQNLPRGTAGYLKDIPFAETDQLAVVLSSMLVPVPSICELVGQHREGGSAMTLFFHPGSNGQPLAAPAPIYICDPAIREHVPDIGYFDLKEGLVPALVKAGKRIHAVPVTEPVGSFRNWREYRAVITDTIGTGRVSDTARIAPSARIVGDVVIGPSANIREQAVVIGPAVVGSHCSVGPGAFVSDAVLWDNAQVGPDCRIQRCVVTGGKAVLGGFRHRDVLLDSGCGFLGGIQNFLARAANALFSVGWQPKYKLSDCFETPSGRAVLVFGCIAMAAAVIGLYWTPTLTGLARIWTSSDEYSSGMLVPFLAAGLLWMRRHQLAGCPLCPSLWLGGGILLAGQAMRVFGLYYMFSSFENLSLMVTVIGLVVMLFGAAATLRLWSVLAFLCLMLPFPNRIRNWIGMPLQEWATASAVFVLETFGFNVSRQGNVINLDGTLVAVAEACNGLRMLTAFIVVCAMVVLMIHRTRLEKIIVLLSCIPIAMLCNTLRLAITSVAFTVLDSQEWEKAFHDYGGLAMMPLALALIVGQLWLLGRLFYSVDPASRAAVDMVYSNMKD